MSQRSDYPNWAAVKQDGATVAIKATVKPNTTDAANLIPWTNGDEYDGDNTVRTVDKGTSAKTAVQAVIGAATAQEVDIWIIWATVTIQITDNLANDNNAQNFTDNRGNYPAILGGGTALGAIDHDAVPGLTYAYTIGRIQATGKLTPSGIGQIISTTTSDGKPTWKLRRTKEKVAWDNGGHYTNPADNTTWAMGPSDQCEAGTDDTSLAEWTDLDPTSGGSVDTIYDEDTPGCSNVLNGTTIYHTSEVYQNLTQFVTVTLDAETTCSDNAVWSYQAQVDGDKAVINLNQLDTQLIAIPGAPSYKKR